MVDGAAWKLHWVSSWTRSSWSSFGSSVPRRQSAGAEHSAVQVTHWWLKAKERQSEGKKQHSLSILQIPPLHKILITSHVTVDVLTQALNLIAMAPLAMRSFFSVAVYQLACCLIPPSHILYHPPYVDLPQICKRELWMLPNVSHSLTCPPIWNVDGKPRDSWYHKIVMHIDTHFHGLSSGFTVKWHIFALPHILYGVLVWLPIQMVKSTSNMHIWC